MPVQYMSYQGVSPAQRPEMSVERCDGTYWVHPEATYGDVTPVARTYEPYKLDEWSLVPPSDGQWQRRHQTGTILMSPLTRSRDERMNFLVATPERGKAWYWPRWYCGSDCHDQAFWEGSWSRDQVDDFYSAQAELNSGENGLARIPDASSKMGAAEQEAFRNATSTVDALTVLAEAVQTYGECNTALRNLARALKAKRPPKGREAWGLTLPKVLLKSTDKAARIWAKSWLAYSFAILPWVLTIWDVNEMLKNKRRIFKTGRAYRFIDATEPPPNQLAGRLLYSEQTGGSHVRSTCKVSYLHSGLDARLFDQVSFGVLGTLWEMTRWSFMVDWALNVGNALYAFERRLDPGVEMLGCTSVKHDVMKTTRLYDDTLQVSTITHGDHPCSPGGLVRVYTYQTGVNDMIYRHHVQRYRRRVWRKPVQGLFPDLHFSWKRQLHTLALSYQPTKRLLKSLL